MIKTRIATIGLSLAFVLGVAATPAQAVTVAELQAQINALMAQLASLQGGTSASTAVTFTQDLTIGSTGAQVTALQQMLVAQGHLVMPTGVAYGYFGTLTQSAVAKWQAANGVTPASGYWGPISRARAAALGITGGTTTGGTVTGGTTTGGTITTPGVEGTLEATLSGEVAGVELNEGENKEEVMAIELDADQSDIRVERVQVDFDTTLDKDIYRDFIDKIYVMHGNTVLASRDVDASTVVEDSNGNLSITLTGLNFVVGEGDEEVLTIAVDTLSNIDSGDISDHGSNVTFTIPQNGIRGVDGAGINQYAPSAAFSQDFDITEETAGDLDISEADDNPDADVVSIDEDENTNGVLVLAFELEANDQDITVDDIPVGLVTSENEGVDGPVRRVILKKGNTTLDTVSVPASAGTSYQAVFDNLDLTIDDGDTEEFQVYVDLNDADVTTFATGTTLYATTTGSDAAWDVEDANGDNVTPSGSVDNSGELLVFQTEGISASLVSTSAQKTTSLGTNVTAEVGEFKIVADITAIGGDMWIDKDAVEDPDRNGAGSAGTGFQWATTTQSSTGTTTVADVVSASGSTSSDSATGYKISEGQTRRFTLTVSLSADTNGVAAVQLTGINYDDDSDTSDSTTFYTTNLSDFKTDLLTLLSS